MQAISHLSRTSRRQLMRASYQHPHFSVPTISAPSSFRLLSQMGRLSYPRKDSQDKDSINTEATEYSKSGTDDASARQENTAFDPGVTDPGDQKDKVGDQTGSQKLADLVEIVDCAQRLLKNASANSSSLNITFLNGLINAQKNLGILCNSSLFEWATTATQKSGHSLRSQVQHGSSADASVNDTSSSDDDDSVVSSYGDVFRHDRDCEDEAPNPDSGALRLTFHAPCVTPLQNQVRRLSAKLHCLYGVPIQHLRVPRSSSSCHGHDLRTNAGGKIHPFARSRVYDLRQHTEGTLWGPFDNDGSLSVDWEKLEALMIILSYNVHLFANRYLPTGSNLLPPWDKPFVGVTPYSLNLHHANSSVERPPALPINLQDPYNVTGTWMRVVCFLDYRELFSFNFGEDQPQPGQPRPPIDAEEAIRFITVKLHVTKIEKPSESDGQGLPVVHFKGSSSSALPPMDFNANSKIRGTVRLTPEDEVRWTTFSVFHGEERWRSEGIQLGGVQAARGVVGYWFDKDFDEYGPAGPTSFWKLSNDPDYDTTENLSGR
ncbi:MAG: hypothetical protein Q9166_000062 [cf. Caloplaca sp. 2 TL-2023]